VANHLSLQTHRIRNVNRLRQLLYCCIFAVLILKVRHNGLLLIHTTLFLFFLSLPVHFAWPCLHTFVTYSATFSALFRPTYASFLAPCPISVVAAPALSIVFRAKTIYNFIMYILPYWILIKPHTA
jgi:hypothetical protein